jgi:hypothetical protein
MARLRGRSAASLRLARAAASLTPSGATCRPLSVRLQQPRRGTCSRSSAVERKPEKLPALTATGANVLGQMFGGNGKYVEQARFVNENDPPVSLSTSARKANPMPGNFRNGRRRHMRCHRKHRTSSSHRCRWRCGICPCNDLCLDPENNAGLWTRPGCYTSRSACTRRPALVFEDGCRSRFHSARFDSLRPIA